MSISRRAFLFGTLGAAALAAPAAKASIVKPESIVIERVDLNFENLPDDLDGLRIGFITDLHISAILPSDIAEKAIALCNEEQVDLVLHGGDYLWSKNDPLYHMVTKNLASPFAGLKGKQMSHAIYSTLSPIFGSAKAKFGSFGVIGNHDGWEDPLGCQKLFAQGNTEILNNQTRTLKRGSTSFEVIGVEDYWTGFPKVPQVETTSKERPFRILISNNPDYVSYLLRRSHYKYDLALCGHTHGGQIKFPVIGGLFYNVQDQRFKEGLAKIRDSYVYTSRGIGTVELPIRVNCPPEVTILTINKA